MDENKHLWEIEHDYYCSESNFFNRGWNFKFNSWSEFVKKDSNCDLDLNLLFRWDWIQNDDENNVLMLFWVLQRKGIFMCDEVKVVKSNEPDIIEWLKPRCEHLMKLWKPIIS